jgi:hypothetical protein
MCLELLELDTSGWGGIQRGLSFSEEKGVGVMGDGSVRMGQGREQAGGYDQDVKRIKM